MANEINFDPIVIGAAGDAETFNAPMRQLDTAIKLNKWDATSAPTVDDDSTDGYSAGSRWLDVSNGTYYVCKDPTPGAAVWLQFAPATQNIDLTITAGENLDELDYVYLKMDGNNKWYQVDIDASPPAISALRGIVVEGGGILQNNTGAVRVFGEATGFAGGSFDAGKPVYAHTTAGGLTKTKPIVSSGEQKAIVKAGIATAATALFVQIWHPVEYLGRDSLADAASLTVTHHADPQAQSRNVAAFITSQDEGTKITDYGSANQDSDVNLMTGIQDSMIEWWELNETSGNRTGSHAAKVLTDIGTVGYGVGKQSYAADFESSSSQCLERASESDLQTGDIDFTFSFWIKLESIVAGTPVCKYSTTNGEYLAWVTAGGIPHFYVYDGATTVVGDAAWGSALSTGTWYHIICWHNAGSNQVGITVNNGTPVTAATTGTPATTSSPFSLGSYNSGGGGKFDGLIDELVFWKRLLSSAERTWLYNAGDARDYAESHHKSKLAQSFQIASAADIGSVKLWLKKVGSPTGNLTAKICQDSGSNTPGTVLATSAAVAASSLATSYGWIEFTFASPPSLSASTTYWILFETTDTVDVDDYVVWGADASSPGYANGEMLYYWVIGWMPENKDACFEVYEEGTYYEEPCVVGRHSAGTRDVGVRFDDGAGADGDTNTTFKNVSGATLDLTCVVELS